LTKYSVIYSDKAVKQLKKLDKQTQRLIFAWIDKNLEGCTDPRARGKGLTANHSGKWRYRVGDYRILAQIEDNEVLILVLEVGHRGIVYR